MEFPIYFFGASMSYEHEKRKKLPGQPVFLRFFGLSSSGRPEFQKLVEQKLFAIMKGNFSALTVKRIREKSKNDPP
jgi:adenylylsulfate kinase-like enzyme